MPVLGVGVAVASDGTVTVTTDVKAFELLPSWKVALLLPAVALAETVTVHESVFVEPALTVVVPLVGSPDADKSELSESA